MTAVNLYPNDHEEWKIWRFYRNLWVVIVFISSLVAIVIPSKTTLLMILASEVGEAAVTSDEGQEMLEGVKTIIRHHIQELENE